MTPFIASLFFGAGVGAWVWAKVGHRTGGADAKANWMAAGLATLAAFLFFYTFMRYILNIH
jgi:hypothetical protein